MKMLLGTDNALVLWDDWRERMIHEKAGAYFGITWSPDTLFVGARAYKKSSRMLAFDISEGELTPTASPPFTQMGRGKGHNGPHQILWNDGRLFVTNTQYNRVDVWDELTGGVGHIHFEKPVGLKDVDHVNSIWRDNKTGFYYVVEHRKALMPKRIRVMDGAGRVHRTIHLDLPGLNAGALHSGLHNVFVKDDVLYTLGPTTIVLYHLHTGDVWEVPIEGIEKNKHYLRGLAVTPDAFLIGASNAAPRHERGWAGSTVQVLNHDLYKVDQIYLKKGWGQIHDIRILDAEDLAHSNRTSFPEGVLKI